MSTKTDSKYPVVLCGAFYVHTNGHRHTKENLKTGPDKTITTNYRIIYTELANKIPMVTTYNSYRLTPLSTTPNLS